MHGPHANQRGCLQDAMSCGSVQADGQNDVETVPVTARTLEVASAARAVRLGFAQITHTRGVLRTPPRDEAVNRVLCSAANLAAKLAQPGACTPSDWLASPGRCLRSVSKPLYWVWGRRVRDGLGREVPF